MLCPAITALSASPVPHAIPGWTPVPGPHLTIMPCNAAPCCSRAASTRSPGARLSSMGGQYMRGHAARCTPAFLGDAATCVVARGPGSLGEPATSVPARQHARTSCPHTAELNHDLTICMAIFPCHRATIRLKHSSLLACTNLLFVSSCSSFLSGGGFPGLNLPYL